MPSLQPGAPGAASPSTPGLTLLSTFPSLILGLDLGEGPGEQGGKSHWLCPGSWASHQPQSFQGHAGQVARPVRGSQLACPERPQPEEVWDREHTHRWAGGSGRAVSTHKRGVPFEEVSGRVK